MVRTLKAAVLGGTVAALLIAPMVGVPPTLAGSDRGEVVFRLTLEGPVPPTHTFAIECGPTSGGENACFSVESIVVVCSPPDPTYDYEPCEARTYELVATPPVGQTIEYTLLRWTTPDLAHTEDQPEQHLAGTWTVHEGRQVISLGFVYPGGSGPSAPMLPDTAMPADG